MIDALRKIAVIHVYSRMRNRFVKRISNVTMYKLQHENRRGGAATSGKRKTVAISQENNFGRRNLDRRIDGSNQRKREGATPIGATI